MPWLTNTVTDNSTLCLTWGSVQECVTGYFPLQLFPCAEWTVECLAQRPKWWDYLSAVIGLIQRAVASESQRKQLLECLLLLLFSSLFFLYILGPINWKVNWTTPNSEMCFRSPNYINGIWLSIFFLTEINRFQSC